MQTNEPSLYRIINQIPLCRICPGTAVVRRKTLIVNQIEAEELPDVSETFEVSSVPFLVLVKNSKILTRVSGANPASLTSALQLHTSASSLPPAQETTTSATSATTEAPKEEDLNERLAKLVKAAPVMLFMKGTPSAPQCGFSRTIVGILREKNVRYGFFNILADEDVRQGLKTFSDWPTYAPILGNF